MRRNLTKFSLLSMAFVFATILLSGCGGSSSSLDPSNSDLDPGGSNLVPCTTAGTVDLAAAEYRANAASTSVDVVDVCAASSTVSTSVDNGTATIAIDVILDDTGSGSATITFGTTDGVTDVIAIASGDTLTASYTDAADTPQTATDSATIIAALAGDTNADGAATLFATDPTTVIDLADGVDGAYSAIQEWGTGSTLEGEYADDTTYARVFQVTPGADAGILAFVGFDAGFTDGYTALHFKFKGATTGIKVKFTDPDNEITFHVDQATDLGDGWYEYAIPLAAYDTSLSTQFAILTTNSADAFYLTDIYFDDAAVASPSLADDDNGDDSVYLYATDQSRNIDWLWGVDYALNGIDGISVWDSGATLDGAYLIDATYAPVWQVQTGWGTWGVNAGALAYASFPADFTSPYTSINFKFKSDDFTDIKLKFSDMVDWPNEGAEEAAFTVTVPVDATYTATDLGDGWYQFSIPLADYYTDLSAMKAFGLLNTGDNSTFYITDINFQ